MIHLKLQARTECNNTHRLVLAFLDLESQQILRSTGDIENHQQHIEEPEDGAADDDRCFTHTNTPFTTTNDLFNYRVAQ